MHRILERMDSISKSCSNMSRRKFKRSNQTFAAAINEVTKTDISDKTSIAAQAVTGRLDTPDETFSPLIAKYAQQNKLDPNLIKSLINVASSNDPDSVGLNGQVGLMQLKPEVFRDFGYTNPFDPEQNISAGSKHLAQLLETNGGNTELALAAYTSDPSTVKRYGGMPPFPATQDFVSQILAGVQNYNDQNKD